MKNKIIGLISLMFVMCVACASPSKEGGVQHRNGISFQEGTFADQLEISFPEVKSFANIASDCQSVDPSIYNFQMWATRDGLYFYVQQDTITLKTDNSNQWVLHFF